MIATATRKCEKLTPEQIAEMKRLKEQGLSYEEIALKFATDNPINGSHVRYHLDPEYRKRVIKQGIEWKKKNWTEDRRKNKREYMRQYIRERYRQDPEFREKQKESSRKSYRKRKKKEVATATKKEEKPNGVNSFNT